MSMIRTLLGYVGEYKKDSILTPLFMIIEVTMEVLIPTSPPRSSTTAFRPEI